MPTSPVPMEHLNFVKDISEDDWMYKGKSNYGYYLRGYEALSIIVNETKKNKINPAQILDFGCGHGNVARMIKAQFPKSTLYGQDVNPEWLSWCRERLKIETILSAPRIADVKTNPDYYDLIWVGSVFTHIPESSFDHLFEQLRQSLTKKGILIFTTAGRFVRDIFDVSNEFLLSPEDALGATSGFDERGYGFAPYTGGTYDDWGRSMVRFENVFEKIKASGMRLRCFGEGGWGRRQDVYAVMHDV